MCSTIPTTSRIIPSAANAQPTSPNGTPPISRPKGLVVGGGSPPFWIASLIALMKLRSAAAKIPKPTTNIRKPVQASHRALVLVAATSRRKFSRCWLTYWTWEMYWSRSTLLMTPARCSSI